MDRCAPFFVGLLGERYGWRPDSYADVDLDDPRFAWLAHFPKGRSITEIEMWQGALRRAAPSSEGARFYMRQPDFSGAHVPAQHRPAFEARDAHAAERMRKLRARIIKQMPDERVMQYEATWGGMMGGTGGGGGGGGGGGVPCASGLEHFRQRVLDDLWADICRLYPHQAVERSPLRVASDAHEALITAKASTFVGRRSELDALCTFASGTDPGPR